MKKYIILVMILLNTFVLADLKSDDINKVKDNEWGVMNIPDEFGDESHEFVLYNTDNRNNFDKNVAISMYGNGFWDSSIMLFLPSDMGVITKFTTVRIKVGDKVYPDEEVVLKTINNSDNSILLDFSADTYATIIDKMIAGEPLKIYVKTLAGESTIFYTNNKDFKSKYNDIHDNFVKYNK